MSIKYSRTGKAKRELIRFSRKSIQRLNAYIPAILYNNWAAFKPNTGYPKIDKKNIIKEMKNIVMVVECVMGWGNGGETDDIPWYNSLDDVVKHPSIPKNLLPTLLLLFLMHIRYFSTFSKYHRNDYLINLIQFT